MKDCTKCGKRVRAGPQNHVLDIGDRIFEGPVDGWRCRSCGEVYYDGPDLERFERVAARWLAENGFATGAELKFMRKAVGIRAAELAEWMGVTPETVSHWETGKHPADVATRTAVAAIVLDAIEGKTTTRDRLEAQRAPEKKKKVRVTRRAA